MSQSQINWWSHKKCAKAFWSQRELPSYKQLLNDTVAWTDPQRGESWLDLGCGGGNLTKNLWNASEGQVERIIGVDIAPVNELAYDRLRTELDGSDSGRIQFIAHNFSSGLSLFDDEQFDGVVSGLSISYAESFDSSSGNWTTEGYDNLLNELWRILSCGGNSCSP